MSALVDRPIRTVPSQVITPDDWLVQVWYRPFIDPERPEHGYGPTRFKAVGVSKPRFDEQRACLAAFKALGVRRPAQVLDVKATRLFKSAYFRRKGETHPQLESRMRNYL